MIILPDFETYQNNFVNMLPKKQFTDRWGVLFREYGKQELSRLVRKQRTKEWILNKKQLYKADYNYIKLIIERQEKEFVEKLVENDKTINENVQKVEEYKTERQQMTKVRRDMTKQWNVAKTRRILKIIPKDLRKDFRLTEHAFKFTVCNFESLHVKPPALNELPIYPLEFFNLHKESTQKLLKYKLQKFKGIKYFLSLTCNFHPPENEEKILRWTFNHKAKTLINEDQITDAVDISHQELLKKFEDFIQSQSGMILESIVGYYVNIVNYEPLRGGSYVELPQIIENSRACINVQNNKDQQCLKWSLLAHKMLQTNPAEKNLQRTSKLAKISDQINDSNINYPVSISDIPKIEKQNDMKLNVYAYNEPSFQNKIGNLYPLYINKNECYPSTAVNLLLYKGHYVLIKDFNRLMRSFLNTTHSTKHFCFRCLHNFTEEKNLIKHLPLCKTQEAGAVRMPSEDKKILQFKHIQRQMKVPFVIYADFECIVEEMEKDENNRSKYQQLHSPCGFGYYVASTDPNYQSKPVIYRGPNAHDKLVSELLDVQKDLVKRINHIEEMKMTPEQIKEWHESTICHICKKEIKKKKVRDHDHITGEYRGPACNGCNINYKKRLMIPVVFHNLKNYDAHFILQVASKYTQKIDCIPQNLEKYISFSISHLRFIDSILFMDSSLETLTKNLKKGEMDKIKHANKTFEGEEFIHTKKFFQGEELNLITQKGVYPYDYMNSFERFSDEQLPSQEHFYSKLTEKELNDSDYAHAKKVWNKFNIQNMGEYHDLYLKGDVLLLADVFERFRNVCMSIYQLDPAHYFTAPSLSWDAQMKMTGAKMELLTCPDKHMLIEKGMRGGIATISHRYARANNKYLKNYNPNEKSSYIINLDANNLYGYSMTEPLPISDFECAPERLCYEIEMNNEKLLELGDDDPIGFLLKVDIEIPHSIHNKMNDYPIAETMLILESMYSPYCKESSQKFGLKKDVVNKLVPNLNNKTEYVAHYRNLKKYIELGCKITKVHGGIQFKQEKWLKNYVDFNTEQRTKATNDFEIGFYKNMNCSIYGKTMENVRKRIDAKICCTEQQKDFQIRKPQCKTWKIFNENTAIVEVTKKEIVLDKPIYAGFAILELSKLHMMNFHYDYIQKKYGEKAKLLFTDTDSLCYHIETEDIYQDMFERSDLFDFSDYDQNPFPFGFHDDSNKKVMGIFKDDSKGRPIIEFVGLRAKCYSILHDDENQKNTAKGVTRCVRDKYLKHEQYYNALFNQEQLTQIQRGFRSEKHQVYTIETEKIVLSPFDNKRYILEDGITTRAYGHYLNNIN